MKTVSNISSHENLDAKRDLFDRGYQIKKPNVINQVDFNDVVKEDLMEEIISPIRKNNRKLKDLDTKNLNHNT